jgi:hypothetical protein
MTFKQLFFVLCITLNSFSVQSEEILHAESEMEIVTSKDGQLQAKFCFLDARNIRLSVFKNGSQCGYSSVRLLWDAKDPVTGIEKSHDRHLDVYSHYCSSDSIATVVARLPKVTDPDDPAFGVRFSVVLTDYTKFEDAKDLAYTWIAKVRSGSGWCGSSDARMTIQGNPTVYPFHPAMFY